MKVQLTNVRLAFANIFSPAPAIGDGDPKYSVNLIIEPGSANAKKMLKAMDAVATEKWGKKAAAIMKDLKAKDKLCFREFEKTNSSGDVYDGFEDMHFCSATSAGRPLIIDRDKTPLAQSDGKPYSGCYVNVSLEVWPQDNSYGKRVNAQLKGVQFVEDGDAFAGGAPASPDDFDDLGVPDEADDELV